MTIDPDDLACQELVELVTDYTEGALSAGDRTRFEEHLLTCRDCTEYFRQMRWTAGGARALAEQGVDPRAEEALLAAFRGRKPMSR